MFCFLLIEFEKFGTAKAKIIISYLIISSLWVSLNTNITKEKETSGGVNPCR